MERSPEALAKLNGLIKDIRLAMLTTVSQDGSLHARPMGTQRQESDGDFWFYTYEDSGKVADIKHDARVNVSYSDGNSTWVSLAGTAVIVTDRAMLERFWSEPLKAWFPQELETPGICLIKVSAQSAEYWDKPDAKVVQLFGFAKAAITGKTEHLGEDVKVDL